MSEMKKTIIRKGIVRKLNTAKYETTDILIEIEQEIEWDASNPKQLWEKSMNLNNYLLKDYKDTETQFLDSLGLDAVNACKNEAKTTRPLTLEEKNSLNLENTKNLSNYDGLF